VTEIVHTGSPFDAIRRTDAEGEHWAGRDLMPLMEYGSWQRFAPVIEKAKASLALVQGADVADRNFIRMARVSGARGPAGEDYRLSRFGAYLVAMAGDDTKDAVALARIYFAEKTREAEVRPAGNVQEMPTHAQALRGWAESIERTEAAERHAAELTPSAAAWDHLASGDGDWSIGDAAKILSRDPAIATGQNRLCTTLHGWGWIYRAGDGKWRAKQAQVECGRLSEVPQSHYHPRTGDLVLDPPQVRVKPKGLVEIHKKLGGTKPLATEQQLALYPGAAA
jgi:DNA-damage-inducible protein D